MLFCKTSFEKYRPWFMQTMVTIAENLPTIAMVEWIYWLTIEFHRTHILCALSMHFQKMISKKKSTTCKCILGWLSDGGTGWQSTQTRRACTFHNIATFHTTIPTMIVWNVAMLWNVLSLSLSPNASIWQPSLHLVDFFSEIFYNFLFRLFLNYCSKLS